MLTYALELPHLHAVRPQPSQLSAAASATAACMPIKVGRHLCQAAAQREEQVGLGQQLAQAVVAQLQRGRVVQRLQQVGTQQPAATARLGRV